MNRERLINLATTELSNWGLLCKGWKVVIDDRPRRRLGQCRYSLKEIGITGWYIDLNDEPLVMDTVLHEIAHALVGWKVQSHGPEWKAMCRTVGCTPEARKKHSSLNLLVPAFVATCSQCKKEFTLHRRVEKTMSYYCPCSRDQEDRENLVFVASRARVREKETGRIIEPKPRGNQTPEISLLLRRLGDGLTSAKDAKKIRAKLRRLGHKGGLRGY